MQQIYHNISNQQTYDTSPDPRAQGKSEAKKTKNVQQLCACN